MMNNLEETPPVIPKERLDKPRILTAQEVFTAAKNDFNEQIKQEQFTEADVEQFTKEKVTGIKVNGVDVVSIDFEHNDEEISPIMKAYMSSLRTRVNVVENFYPEIERNAINSGLYDAMNDADKSYQIRLDYARRLAEICKETGKPAVVADIANKASYLVSAPFFRVAPAVASLLGFMITRDNKFVVPTMASMGWAFGLEYMSIKGKEIFNKDSISQIEKFVFDFEQARRLYLAKGVEQLTTEYPPSQGKGDPQIVVVYPKAHGIRMADALVNPEPKIFSKVKDFTYKLFGPNLDYSVRTYVWKDSLQRLVSGGYRWKESGGTRDVKADTAQPVATEIPKDSLANWMLISDRKIQI